MYRRPKIHGARKNIPVNKGNRDKVKHGDKGKHDVRPHYDLYVIIFTSNSDYFVGNVYKRSNSTILIQDGYEKDIPNNDIYAKIEITEEFFRTFQKLDADSLLNKLKQLAKNQKIDITTLEKLGNKKVVKRPTKKSADSQTIGYKKTSPFGYLSSLLNPIDMKDWIYAQNKKIINKKNKMDDVYYHLTKKVMKTGAKIGGVIEKKLKEKKPANNNETDGDSTDDDSTDGDSTADDDSIDNDNDVMVNIKKNALSFGKNVLSAGKNVGENIGKIVGKISNDPSDKTDEDSTDEDSSPGDDSYSSDDSYLNKWQSQSHKTKERIKQETDELIQKIKEKRDAKKKRDAIMNPINLEKKNKLFSGTFKQFVSL